MGSRLSSLLVQEGFTTLATLKEALALQVIRGGQLDTILLEKKSVGEPAMLGLLGRATGYPPLEPAVMAALSQEAGQVVALELAVRLGICPVSASPEDVVLLVSGSSDPVHLEELAFELGRRLSPFVATEVRLLQARRRIYGVELPPRYQRLLDKLGELPPPADIQVAEGVASLPILTPHIQPRRRPPSQPLVPAPFQNLLDSVADAEEEGVRLLSPLGSAAPLAEPPEIPKDITDEFPPLPGPAAATDRESEAAEPDGDSVTEPPPIEEDLEAAGQPHASPDKIDASPEETEAASPDQTETPRGEIEAASPEQTPSASEIEATSAESEAGPDETEAPVEASSPDQTEAPSASDAVEAGSPDQSEAASASYAAEAGSTDEAGAASHDRLETSLEPPAGSSEALTAPPGMPPIPPDAEEPPGRASEETLELPAEALVPEHALDTATVDDFEDVERTPVVDPPRLPPITEPAPAPASAPSEPADPLAASRQGLELAAREALAKLEPRPRRRADTPQIGMPPTRVSGVIDVVPRGGPARIDTPKIIIEPELMGDLDSGAADSAAELPTGNDEVTLESALPDPGRQAVTTGDFAPVHREPEIPYNEAPTLRLPLAHHSSPLAPQKGVAVEEAAPAQAPAPEHGALALEMALTAMARAKNRDDVLLALARGAHGLLECVQLYVMRRERLQGHLELVVGAVDWTEIRSRHISLGQPSVISRAVADGGIFIGPAPDTDSSPSTLISVGILALRGICLVPVTLRGKTVCLLAGHNYDQPVSQRLRRPLARLAEEAAAALAALILRQKSEPDPEPAAAPEPLPEEPGDGDLPADELPTAEIAAAPLWTRPHLEVLPIPPDPFASVPDRPEPPLDPAWTESPTSPAPMLPDRPPAPFDAAWTETPTSPGHLRVPDAPGVAYDLVWRESPTAPGTASRVPDRPATPFDPTWTESPTGPGRPLGPESSWTEAPTGPGRPVADPAWTEAPTGPGRPAVDPVWRESPTAQMPVRPGRAVPADGFPFDSVGSTEPHRTSPDLSTAAAAARHLEAEAVSALPALLARLEEGGGDASEAEAEIVRLGTAALNLLITQFPGWLRIEREDVERDLPPVWECSAVLRAIMAFGRQAIPALAPLFHHREAQVRFFATYLMSELIYPEGISLLANQLQDPDPGVRWAAAHILWRFKEMDQFPEVLLDLRADLSNPDPRPRRAAADALAALGDADSVAALVALLEDTDAGVSEAAYSALVLLTKQDFALNASKWLTWWEANRGRPRLLWLIDGLVHSTPEIRNSAGIDLQEITGMSFGYRYDLPPREREAVRRRFLEWWAETGRFRVGRS